MVPYKKSYEFIMRHRGLVLFITAICLLGGQIATMSMLAEDNEIVLAESYRLDMSGGVSSEFGKVDKKALDAFEKSEQEAKSQQQADKTAEKKSNVAAKNKDKNKSNVKEMMAQEQQNSPHPLKDKIADLSSSNPLSVKCFGTKPYTKIADGSKAFESIKGGMVQKLVEEREFSDKLTSPESIVARMWLARQRALQAEGGQTHLAALGNYLVVAQRTLKDAHQYYGDEGLDWAKTLLNTRADKRVLQQIKIRVPSKRFTRKLNQKMQLLLDHPDDFIPCTKRAEQQFGMQASAQL